MLNTYICEFRFIQHLAWYPENFPKLRFLAIQFKKYIMVLGFTCILWNETWINRNSTTPTIWISEQCYFYFNFLSKTVQNVLNKKKFKNKNKNPKSRCTIRKNKKLHKKLQKKKKKRYCTRIWMSSYWFENFFFAVAGFLRLNGGTIDGCHMCW